MNVGEVMVKAKPADKFGTKNIRPKASVSKTP